MCAKPAVDQAASGSSYHNTRYDRMGIAADYPALNLVDVLETHSEAPFN